MTLHGQVVGLGVQHADGSKDFRWLDKPIHNRIVSGGLDAWFQLDGSNTATTTSSDWDNRLLSSYASNNYPSCGLLQYMAIGTDGTPTHFTDTTLGAQVGDYSRAVSYTTAPYIGFCVNSDNTVSTRRQTTSIAVTDSTTVREIGWFEKYTNANTYVMFSRVVLDSPVTLESGESLLVCYQINITIANFDETEVPTALLTGLLDEDGNQVKGLESTRIYRYSIDNLVRGQWYYGTSVRLNLGCIVGNIGNVPITMTGFAPVATFKTGYSSYNVNGCAINSRSTSGWSLPVQFERSRGYSSESLNDEVNNFFEAWAPLDYVPGTYYRDRVLITNPAWPNNNTTYKDIYAIAYCGHCIRFGYMDTTDPSNPVWVPKPWRKQFGERYKFTFRYKLSTADTV